MNNRNSTAIIISYGPAMFSLQLLLLFGCEDFVKIDPPRTGLVQSTVFTTDATANAAIVDLYYQMSLTGAASGDQLSTTYITTFSSDEQINYSIPFYQEFNDNELSATNTFVLSLWTDFYKYIYQANAIIEGIAEAQSISESIKTQIEGEAKFIRGFCYFYLVNLYGKVPLVTMTDYRTNANISRTAVDEVYRQIIDDLKEAQKLLPENYAFAHNERVRANRSAATALLARTYLHTGEWAGAEQEASKIIENTSLYSLPEDLSTVFHKNSGEAILQFHTTFYPKDFLTFRVFSDGPSMGALRPEFSNNFEVNDQRAINWVRSITVNDITYFYPGKYKIGTIGLEYSTILRLAETYLIRAEARAQQENIEGSQNDLNIIRHRAGLGNTTANSKETLLAAIDHERVVELFTEQGLRWLDLKRTGKADEVLAPIKGVTWQATDVLYPIPEYQLLNDPAMANDQNPGY